MRSFINSSSESDSETECTESRKKSEDESEGVDHLIGRRTNIIEERKKPPRQSVFEYMSQQKVMIHGTANLDDHIHSTFPSIPEVLKSPKKKKRKTFYDSSDEDDGGDEEEKTPNYASTPQSSLVVGDLFATISPLQVSPSSSSDQASVPAVDDDLDDWLESPQSKQNREHSSSSLANRKRKVSKQHVEWSSSDEENEEVRPQLKTAVPVRELASVTLGCADSVGPSDDSTSPLSPPLPYINKYAAQYLKDYQIQGVQWLYQKYSSKAGCILGDDMGLGKTIQVAALLLALFEKTGRKLEDHANNRLRRRRETEERSKILSAVSIEPSKKWTQPCLIVCPASVIDNWRDELARWGYFLVSHLLGSNQDGGCLEAIGDAKHGRVEILICSYSKMQSYASDLAEVSWSMIIWDEGHNLKTSTTKTYKAAFSLSKAQSRVILTGTPIQNKLEELWCLLNIVTYGRFNDKTSFKTHFVTPIKRAQQRSATRDIQRLGLKRQNELRKLVGRYLLQRLKSEVLAEYLQGKDDIVVFCELSPLQSSLYQHILSLPDVDNARWSKAPCPCGSQRARKACCEEYQLPFSRDGSSEIDIRAAMWRQNHPDFTPCQHCPSCVLLPAISKLLKVASHPYLLKEYRHNTDNDSHSKTYEFACTALTDTHLVELGGPVFSSSILSGSRIEMSGKMKALDRLLSHFSSHFDKTLVFSNSTKMLSLIEMYVQGKGWRYCRLDGSTSTASRQSLVDRFNSDPSLLIFLMSTKAGGLGLNLTSASKVIVFDCNWNPALDMQAQDRAYRFGQTRHVSVYRLVAQGTVEELIYMRQLYKQSLQKTAVKVSEVIASVTRQSEDNSARFEGIQGEVSGELFGIENMLQYEDGSILMKLREKYRTSGVPQDREQRQLGYDEGSGSGGVSSAEGKEEGDDLGLVLPPVAALGSRPSLISITEDHAVNILSQLSRHRHGSSSLEG